MDVLPEVRTAIESETSLDVRLMKSLSPDIWPRKQECEVIDIRDRLEKI